MSAGSATALIAGGVAAAGAVGGAAISASAADDATNAQLQAQREQIAFQREQAEKAEAALKPFRDLQLQSAQSLQQLANPNSELAQMQRRQSTEAIQRQLAAQGLLRSRNQSDLLSNLEVGLAQNRANILGTLASGGAASNMAGNYINAGQTIGSSLGQIGATIGQGYMSQANAINSGIQGINNSFQGAFGAYQNQQQNQWLKDFLNKRFGDSQGSDAMGGIRAPLMTASQFTPNGLGYGNLGPSLFR